MRILALLLALAGPAAADELRVGFAPWPPFVSTDGPGGPVGFDVDVAHALCDLGGYDCVFTVRDLSELFDMLEAGELDMALGGLGYTTEREERFDLSCVYVPNNGAESLFFGLAGSSVPDFPLVAVDAQSIQEDTLAGANINYAPYVGDLAGLEALIRGEVDLFFGAPEIVEAYSVDLPPLETFGGLRPKTAGTVIAMPGGQEPLRARINSYLGMMNGNGTLDQIKSQHPAFQDAPMADCGLLMLSGFEEFLGDEAG